MPLLQLQCLSSYRMLFDTHHFSQPWFYPLPSLTIPTQIFSLALQIHECILPHHRLQHLSARQPTNQSASYFWQFWQFKLFYTNKSTVWSLVVYTSHMSVISTCTQDYYFKVMNGHKHGTPLIMSLYGSPPTPGHLQHQECTEANFLRCTGGS